MSDDANTLLKGMLGIQGGKVEEKKKDGEKKTKSKAPKPANKTPPKPRKLNNDQGSAKNTRGKRGGGKKPTKVGDGKKEVDDTKPSIATNSGKKKRNKKRDSQGGNEGNGEHKKTPNLKDAKQYNSEKQNAKNFAWSAFQSSPDPSTLPDIEKLFLGDEKIEAKDADGRSSEKKTDDLEASLNFGPPSDRIRTSLVDSMLANTGEGVNPGETLLKSLTTSTRQSFSNPMPTVKEQFRTAESLEKEMMSSSLQPEEKSDVGQSSLSKLDSADTENGANEEKRDDSERAAEVVPQTKSISPNPAEQPTKTEYPDAISQLMNPGGFDGGDYGMRRPLPHHPQHASYQQYHLQHHQPPGPGYYEHHGPPHPMHHQQHHLSPPYHTMPQPSFTTIQVRVPQSLLPGNTMIVEGMQVQVPPGVPPGAIIPVNIPIIFPQHNYYGHPTHPPPNFSGGYHHQMHPGQHPMMPPPQQQNPSQLNSSRSSSWAAKVTSGKTESNDTPETDINVVEPKA